MINQNILDFMGNTPLIKIQKLLTPSSADVYVKLEEFNPGGSIKVTCSLQDDFRGRRERGVNS